MSQPSENSRGRAAQAFLALAMAGAAAALIDWGVGEKPAQVECFATEAYASPQLQDQFWPDAGPHSQWRYVHAVQCYQPGDAGSVPTLPGVIPVPETQKLVADTGKKLKAKRPGEADGFECACSTGPGCEYLLPDGGWANAPKTGNTLWVGQWRGACRPKVCVELSGASSAEAACQP